MTGSAYAVDAGTFANRTRGLCCLMYYGHAISTAVVCTDE